jgi:hypothetical protein
MLPCTVKKHIKNTFIKFTVSTTVTTTNISGTSSVIGCIFADVCRRFGEIFCLHHQGMEATGSSETSAYIHHITRCLILDDRNLREKYLSSVNIINLFYMVAR